MEMMHNEFSDIDSASLKNLVARQPEDSYELVDVRQPSEYRDGHIAGARLLPLGELSARLSELPADRDIIFYCRSGRRSRTAAMFYTANRPGRHTVYNLTGGILAWSGLTMHDAPALEVFDTGQDLGATLYTAMDLERGAWKFYSGLLPRLAGSPLEPVIRLLAQAEEGHAKLIYRFWAKLQDNPPSFEEVYENLRGDIIEGGQSVRVILDYIMRQEGEGLATVLVEMALMIEYSAYDLYRTMAHRQSGTEMEEPFLAVAQAEKEHMRLAAEALNLLE